VYDPKNETHEFTDVGRSEAIAKACEFYGVGEDQLEIGGYAEGAVYGLATRAVIVAVPKGRTPSSDSGPSDRSDGRRDSGRGRERERGRERGGRGRDRDRGSDSDRGDRPRGRSRDRIAKSEEPPAPSTEASVGKVHGELGEMGQFLLGVMERLGLGPFEISEGEENELTVIEVKGPAAQTLASDEGRTVDALQLLANQVSARIDPDRPRVVIEIEGNADAREEFLTKLADRVAKRALQTGRPVALDPMNGRDRRTIHIALKERDDVATMSEGEGRYRQVVVVPEGADEFNEAAASSERSGDS
jgi:spoIIIJ-associated protein